MKKLPGVGANIRQGTLDGFDKEQGAVIGARLAEHLSLRVGDRITLLAPGGAQTPFGVTPRRKAYPVAATFQVGMSNFDNTFIFLPLPEAQAYFNQDGQANVIEVYVDDPDHMDEVRDRIEPALQRPMITIDWRQRDKTFFDALNVERNVMFSILDADRAGRRAQHRLRPDHAGAGQIARHRGAAHDGRDERRR